MSCTNTEYLVGYIANIYKNKSVRSFKANKTKRLNETSNNGFSIWLDCECQDPHNSVAGENASGAVVGKLTKKN